MLLPLAIVALNHLLGQAAWASDKLKPHAGRVALLVSGPVALRLQIESDGRFAEAAQASVPDATIELPTAALPQAFHGFDAVSRRVAVSGNAEFAETLGYVLRNLRWDAEEDLSRFVGDIAAHRMASGLKEFLDWQQAGLRSLAASTADYLAEERALLLRSATATALANETDALRDDLARLEKRLDKLERS